MQYAHRRRLHLALDRHGEQDEPAEHEHDRQQGDSTRDEEEEPGGSQRADDDESGQGRGLDVAEEDDVPERYQRQGVGKRTEVRVNVIGDGTWQAAGEQRRDGCSRPGPGETSRDPYDERDQEQWGDVKEVALLYPPSSAGSQVGDRRRDHERHPDDDRDGEQSEEAQRPRKRPAAERLEDEDDERSHRQDPEVEVDLGDVEDGPARDLGRGVVRISQNAVAAEHVRRRPTADQSETEHQHEPRPDGHPGQAERIQPPYELPHVQVAFGPSLDQADEDDRRQKGGAEADGLSPDHERDADEGECT